MNGYSINVDFGDLDFERYDYYVRAKCGSLVVKFIEVVDDILFG